MLLLYTILVYAALAFALYWIIRLAMRHSINDTK